MLEKRAFFIFYSILCCALNTIFIDGNFFKISEKHMLAELMRGMRTIFSGRLVEWLQCAAPLTGKSLSFADKLQDLVWSEITGVWPMLKKYIAAVLFLFALLPLTVAAAPSLRYQTNIHGDFVMIGGPVGYACESGNSGITPDNGTCPTTFNNTNCGSNWNDYEGIDLYWHSDNNSATASSAITLANARTAYKLQLPAGATVQKAYLYWFATQTITGPRPATGADTSVILDRVGPGRFGPITITASQSFTATSGTYYGYQSVADVTSIVATNGSGTYRVSGINTATIWGIQDYVASAGWYMVVLYNLSSDPLRNLAVFDGLDIVNGSTVTANLSGFEVPNAGFDGKLGVAALEGDLGFTGDSLSFNGNVLGTGAAGLNPNNNFFNSSRTNFDPLTSTVNAVSVSGDLPRLKGVPGSEAGMDLDIVNIKPYLTAGQTSATISAATNQDVFFLAAFVTSISTYRPNFASSTKIAVDVNGAPLLVGDIIEYTLNVVNSGNDASVGTVLSDTLPTMVDYVPGTLQIVSGTNAGAKTDASGDDQGEYDPANRKVYFYLGTGASGTQGGRMAIGASATVKFRVQVKAGVYGNLANQATITASGELGAPQGQTPTDDDGTGQDPTIVVVDECVTNANCSSPEPYCKTAASPKVCVACLSNADCNISPNLYCSPTTNTCGSSCVLSVPPTEVCNGKDDDCNGLIDDGLTQNIYYRDADGDTYGNPAVSIQACIAPPGYVANSLDCNDSNAGIKPGATEICDGIDNNCDSQIDEYLPLHSYYRDADGDNYGNAVQVTQTCSGTPPSGYVVNSADCNDANAAVHPGATEVCNGIDDNCVGGIDEGLPLNTYYRDSDGDTYGNASVTTQTCSATPPAGYVANSTDCNDSDNTQWQHLNGYVDADNDGYGTGTVQVVCSGASLPGGYSVNRTDCNDCNAAINPYATET